MSTKTTQLDWREGRRRRAWELNEADWKQQDIAAALDVTPGVVSQWLKRAHVQGVEALRRHPARGRQPRISPEQVRSIADAAGVRAGIIRVPRPGLDEDPRPAHHAPPS